LSANRDRKGGCLIAAGFCGTLLVVVVELRSIGIYLFHEGVVHATRSAFADYGFALPALLALAATLVLAECSWRWLESPFIAWARRVRYAAPRPKEQVLTAAATKDA
jgi:peptidoglycan/LPS O-acetylase OafA/YrhL